LTDSLKQRLPNIALQTISGAMVVAAERAAR